jgi:tetratricopeptide (TPR) repeat protein
MLLLLEDWHWCDEASESVLRHLSDVISGYPLMVVVSYRHDYKADWGHLTHHTHLDLKALDTEHAEAVIHAVLGAQQLPTGFAGRIMARAGGNPFFIEELCRGLQEQGALRVNDGRAEPSGDPDKLTLPDSVQAIIRTRLDRLDAEARTVLRLAAVVGAEFAGDVLEKVVGDAQRLHPALETLKQQELVHQIRVFPEPAYRFNHAITHDVVYDSILLRERERLHGQVAQVIEALHADRLEEHYEALAYHYGNSAFPRQALRYAQRAGYQAAQVYALQDARNHFRGAMQLLDKLAPEPELQRLRCDIAVKWAQVSFYAPSRELAAVLKTALEAAEALEDAERLAKLTYWGAVLAYAFGNHPQALQGLQRCQELRAVMGEDAYALTINYLGRVYFYLGKFEKSIEHLRLGITLLGRSERQAEAINSMGLLVMNYGFTGDFHHVPELASRIFDMAVTLRNPTIESMGCVCVGLTNINRGRWSEARELLLRAAGISHKIGNPLMEGLALWGIGCADVMLGQHEPGLTMMNEGIAAIESTESQLGLSAYYGLLAERYAVLGRERQARAFANKALRVGQAGERLGDDSAYSALAILAARGQPPDWEQAQAHLEEALRICRENGARTKSARYLLQYAELLGERGEVQRAHGYLEEAQAHFADMGMDWWLDRARALSDQLSA